MFEMTLEEKQLADEQKRKNQEEMDRQATLYASVFNTENGRKVLKQLELICNAHNSTIKNQAEPNPYAVMKEEGRRQIYEFIVSHLRYDNERRKRQ